MSGTIKKRVRKLAAGIILLVLVQTRYVAGQNDLTDSLINERLETIRQMLDHGKTNANRWWYGWLVGYSAATLAQTAVMIGSEDVSTRQDMALGAMTTFLGAAGQIVSPMVPGYASEKIRQLPGQTREEKMNKLTESERLLEESAIREKNGRSWKIHAICGIVNLGSGLVTWIGFNRSIWAGIGNFALNTAITETQIFTQPKRAIRDYDNYSRKYGMEEGQICRRPDLNWYVNISPGRVAILVVF